MHRYIQAMKIEIINSGEPLKWEFRSFEENIENSNKKAETLFDKKIIVKSYD